MGIAGTPSGGGSGGGNAPADNPYVAPGYVPFPSPTMMEAAPYKFVYPRRFARGFAQFNRKQILQNYELASQIAMRELDQELQGLYKFAPAAAALKRQETAADNRFNQFERLAMVDYAMPGARQSLASQGQRAEMLAQGNIEDILGAQGNRALELGMRSRAADNATAGGFGVSSSVARKASDLMSAETRYGMSMQQRAMGEQLLGNNIQQTAGLVLAPTEYSNVGQNINVMPEVGAGRLTAAALSETNALTMIPTTTAFQAKIQQRQFTTNLEQQARLANQQATNTFALAEHGYEAGYQGVLAGTQTANNLNAQGQDQQAQAAQIFQDALAAAQQAQTAGAYGQLGGAAPGIISSAGNLMNTIAGIWNPNNQSNRPVQPGPQSTGDYGPSDVNPNDYPVSDEGVIEGPPPDVGPTGVLPPESGGGGGGGGGYDSSGGYHSTGDYGSGDTGGGGGGGGEVYRSSRPTTANSFTAATGVPYNPSLDKSSASTFRAAGITKDQKIIPDSVLMAADQKGENIYSSPTLLAASDHTAGATMTTNMATLLEPLGAFTDADMQKLNYVASVASDPQTLSELDGYAAKGDSAGFTNAVLGAYGRGTTADLAKTPDRAGVETAHDSFQASQFWGQTSPEQKSLMMGLFGLKATKLSSGKNLGDTIIPNTQKPGTTPVTVGKAADWFRQGINAYPLTRKWDQFNTIAKVVGGASSPDTIAQMSKSLGLLGAGVQGAEVPNVTAQSLARDGWKPMPRLGVGAIIGGRASSIPQGYVKVADTGDNVVIAPKGTASTAQAAISPSASFRSYGGTGSTGPFNFANQSSSKGLQNTQNILNWGAGAANIAARWPGNKTGAIIGGAQIAGEIASSATGKEYYGEAATSMGDLYNGFIQAQKGNYLGGAAWGTAASLKGIQAYANAVGDKALGAMATKYSSIAGNTFGSLAQAYQGYLEAKKGNYVGAAAFGSNAALRGTLAYAKATGNKALAESVGKYVPYAQAGLNFYDAYNQYKGGNKFGAATNVAGGVGELAGATGAGLIGGGAAITAQGWGKGNTVNGVVGGSMMMAGTLMLCGGPVGWAVGGGLMAASVIGNTAKTGKTNKEHIARDGIRDMFKSDQLGFMDKQTGNVTLADGSTYRMDNENDDDRHTVAHPEMLTEKDKGGDGSLRAYDTDYTNDLDFFSAMGGQTLTRLVAGRADTATDQMGCELGNAGIANIGYGQEMTPENFNKMVANQRAFFSKMGIGSKEDAAQLANQAFAEGRLNELQHTQAMQSLNMIFDQNGYETAQKLASGRQKGVEAAQGTADAEAAAGEAAKPLPPAQLTPEQTGIGSGAAAGAAGGAFLAGMQSAGIAPIARPTYPEGGQTTPTDMDYLPVGGGPATVGSDERLPADWKQNMVPYSGKGTYMRSRDELRALNAQRYQTAMA